MPHIIQPGAIDGEYLPVSGTVGPAERRRPGGEEPQLAVSIPLQKRPAPGREPQSGDGGELETMRRQNVMITDDNFAVDMGPLEKRWKKHRGGKSWKSVHAIN